MQFYKTALICLLYKHCAKSLFKETNYKKHNIIFLKSVLYLQEDTFISVKWIKTDTIITFTVLKK